MLQAVPLLRAEVERRHIKVTSDSDDCYGSDIERGGRNEYVERGERERERGERERERTSGVLPRDTSRPRENAQHFRLS